MKNVEDCFDDECEYSNNIQKEMMDSAVGQLYIRN